MNYFITPDTAERYAKGRPFFHRNTIGKIKDYLKINNKLEKVLDIACGTGLSTEALLDIAKIIYATDASEAMLKWAPQNDKIIYAIARAEKQPFPDNEFDLITVSSGVHWFDIDNFLIETNRMLKDKSWLVLYENYFLAEMDNVKEFKVWFHSVYLKEFPSPLRNNNYEWTSDDLAAKNLTLKNEDLFENTVEFSKTELILYFTTQSNVTARVAGGQRTYFDIEDWLDKELVPFFQQEKRKLHYGNWIKYLQKK